MAIAMIAFAGMLAYFLVLAAQNPEPLIAEDYYEQELKYQDRIDAGSRTLALSGKVRIAATREVLMVGFPTEVKDRAINGTLLLLRADVAGEDRSIVIASAPGGSFTEAVTLRPGRYIAQLEWRADTTKYYSEEQLIVP